MQPDRTEVRDPAWLLVSCAVVVAAFVTVVLLAAADKLTWPYGLLAAGAATVGLFGVAAEGRP